MHVVPRETILHSTHISTNYRIESKDYFTPHHNEPIDQNSSSKIQFAMPYLSLGINYDIMKHWYLNARIDAYHDIIGNSYLNTSTDIGMIPKIGIAYKF